ncbi:methyl-accepting chemotaxis protein [Aquincola tertiaricarbonis]|uniref:Methyl-accepting chemotaxis protein n=1 Tax=Aquincola tertiaricarbonis TaxID=391953 RepID=A0ABY4SFC6_AQUTE|nr:PAS domain-containing methyl-accepting chemotaxis protein [Aquincola tertiaricarbonis]URI10832.1 methyl-accepting chemotaxis protein [Aquincola tertiaricarbonis]
MRTNLPVTGREHVLPAGQTLLSTTDTRSIVTYANASFCDASGFTLEELLGQPHNQVRHPDMPPEAFADMWRTLKAGRSWSALVKNRRKNGDHYWVRANAAPVQQGGQVTGYMSVRTHAPAQEVQQAEALYRRFREGRAGGLAFREGIVVHTGWRAWRSLLRTMPVSWRVQLGTLAMGLGSALTLWQVAPAGAAGGVAAGLATIAGLTALAGLWQHRQIVQPLQRLQQQALQVAAGQTHETASLNRIDEIGTVARSINQAGLNLRALLDDVKAQAVGVQTASEEIAQGNVDLSQRTEEASANLEETAASMEQMTAAVQQSSAQVRETAALSASASAAAAGGGELMREVVQTMQSISQSSQRIAEIIGVIDGIAFQTNILALNAAVEAARAGEQGRGFAVVAGEVRSLAQRSAQAAKEIKSLIASSTDHVERGSKLVDTAGGAMADIVDQVARTRQLIEQINASNQEQALGIEQVNRAVGTLDEMTQRNAALVEQSAAASGGLQQRASRLVDAVVAFAR